MSPPGDQFCRACGELLVLADPPTSDIPVLDYSSDSFSEFIASNAPAAAAEPSAEVAHEPHASYSRPSPAVAAHLESTPAPAGPHGQAGTADGHTGVRTEQRQSCEEAVDTPFEVPLPAEPAFGDLRLAPGTLAPGTLAPEPANSAAGPYLVGAVSFPQRLDVPAQAPPVLDPDLSPGLSTPVASPGTALPAGHRGSEPAPRQPRHVLVTLAILVLVAGATALGVTLSDHSNALTAGQSSTFPAGPFSPSGAARGAWSSTTPVPASLLHGAALTGLSCPLPSVCYAIDSAGHVLSQTKPGPWQVDAAGGAALTAISCATTQFCLALGQSGHALLLHGDSEAKPLTVDTGDAAFTAASCPSRSFCMTTGSRGNAFSYTAAGWHQFTVDSTGKSLTSVSCVSADFCVAVGSSGDAFTYNGRVWSGPVEVGDGRPLVSVSCASETFCVAADEAGHAGALKDGHWKATAVGITVAKVACPGAGFCVATGTGGHAEVYHAGRWAPPRPIDGSAPVGMLTCPSVTGCTAADTKGNVMTYVPAQAAH